MSSDTEIRRKVELWLCAELNASLAPLVAFPSLGGNLDDAGADTQPAANTPTGPYIGVRVIDAHEELNANTWSLTAEVIYISHMADVASPQHAADARAIWDLLTGLRDSCPGLYEPINLRIHGVEVATGEAYNDDEDQSNGSALKVTLGVTG